MCIIMYTLGLVKTSTVPLQPAGALISSLDCSAAAAPGTANPPPTNNTLPYSFFFMSSEAINNLKILVKSISFY